MRARTVLWGAILGGLVLALAAWLVFRERPAERPSPRAGQGARVGRGTSDPEASTLETPLARHKVGNAEPEAQPVAEPGSKEAPADGLDLRGTLVVIDPDGEEHAEEDGSLTLITWKGDTGSNSPQIQVKKGQWTAHLPIADLAGIELGITDVVAGGREAVVEPDRVPFPEDGALEIRAAWLREFLLQVVGEDTRADLAAVTVIHARDFRLDDMEYPGAYDTEDVLARDEPSPVAIRPAARKGFTNHPSAVLWAGSPGYAWGRIEVDFKTGGERLLVLKKGANLQVVLAHHRAAGEGERELVVRVRKVHEPEPESPERSALKEILEALDSGEIETGPEMSKEELRKLLTSPEAAAQLEAEAGAARVAGDKPAAGAASSPDLAGEPIAEAAPPEAGPVRFEGLPPGKYVLRAEVGDWFQEPLVLAGAPVEPVAGETASVTLELSDRPRRGKPVPLAGTLYLPEAWGESSLALYFEPLNRPQAKEDDRLRVGLKDMEPVPGQPGLHRWSAGRVVPGKYQAKIHEFEYQQVIDVGPQGRRDVEIKIGEPVEVTVRLVDAETGAVLDAGRVHWNCQRPEGISGGGLNSAERDAETGEFRFRAPAGRIEVSTWSEEYVGAGEVFDVTPGASTFTLELQKGCGFIIRVREGDRDLPHDLVDKALDIHQVGGKGYVLGESGAPEGSRSRTPAPTSSRWGSSTATRPSNPSPWR